MLVFILLPVILLVFAMIVFVGYQVFEDQRASASLQQQNASMEEITKASESLAQLAQEMQEEVSKFKL